MLDEFLFLANQAACFERDSYSGLNGKQGRRTRNCKMGFVSCKRYLKIAIAVLVFFFVWLSMLLKKRCIVDRYTLSDGSGHSDGNYISFRNSNEFAVVSTTEAELKITAKCGKFVLAFSFGDQLTWATESLLALAAVESYGGRDVVVPFVKHSRLYGTKIDDNTGTLSRYFDLEKPVEPET